MSSGAGGLHGHILAVVTGNIPSRLNGPVNTVQAEAICAVIADSFRRCQHAGILRLIDDMGRDECSVMKEHDGLPHCWLVGP